MRRPAGARAKLGMRLDAVEVFNWGTFDKTVWRLDLNRDNTLLTGDIGSGKSTLVDAITTLLIPAHRIAYNKAAGAETRERDLRSYVLGYYKSERGFTGNGAKPVALRNANNYSVILGRFFNEGYNQHVTLAQVFWFRDSHGQPERFFVIADRPLSIVEHFSNFDRDVSMLKKRLRKNEFTLQDFRDQIRMVQKMGPLSGVLGMLPGMGALKNVNLEDGTFTRVTALIDLSGPMSSS